ncbi:uncharacterized protein LOC134444691 [Engraulis encrasicolus]|uniref:uncharacterized protein LOC134444691 n=1 Tax=Engraulis encrasicolus TaxID=184585 RepID=UPI002FD66C13
MAEEKKAARRHYLLCPVCLKTQDSLSCHLRRVCMKDKTGPQILEVVEKAKNDVCDLLKNGRAFSYKVLKQIVSSPNPLEGLIEELKYHHLFVTGAPSSLPIDDPTLVTERPADAPGEAEPSDVESCSSGELFQCRQERTYSKDKIVQKRHDLLFDKSQPTPRECLAVLHEAEGDIVKIMNQLDDTSSSSLSMTQCLTVLYYLEAIVILGNCQRPCVVQSMRVSEWLDRKQAEEWTIVSVKDHKTAGHFMVSIALSKKEEGWFEKYYNKVRPQLLAGERKRKRDEQDEKDGDAFFFVSSSGRPINNADGDLIKLQKKYNVPQVSSQVVRRVFETAANRMDDSQKKAMSDYMNGSWIMEK